MAANAPRTDVRRDRRFVVAIEDQLIDQMASGDVLADDPSFREAVGYLPKSSGWVAYADAGQIVGAVIDFRDNDMTLRPPTSSSWRH